ncbi:MAG TPA: DNA/RNA nuclease SfsA [Spirochaetota bacterium]|nr:DNA/RNA nuclease SfsA [Spirochaetota bacterium]
MFFNPAMNIYPDTLTKAVLVKRINRFVAEVILDDEPIYVYVPNTGRLSELALPGSEVLLSPIKTKYKFKILYIINRSFPVMIDSTYSNRLFHELLKIKKVPALDHYSSIKSEPVYENHRFDFLIGNENKKVYIELKSCTLFHNTMGSFPDAVSTRASEHVKALAESGKGKLIFFVLKSDIKKFLPNYHTDFIFYETLKYYQNIIDMHAFTVQYDDNLKINSLKEIPVIIPDVKPYGIFIIILFNAEDIIDDDGEILEQGYYLFCEKSDENVFRIIKSVKSKNGLRTIIPDERFSKMKIMSDLPIINPSITIDEVKNKLLDHDGREVSFYNQDNKVSDNSLIYYKSKPSEKPWFWEMILQWRFGEYS